jgi:hypothetical protein
MVLRKCGSQAALEAGVQVKEARAIMGMAAGKNMMNRMVMGRSLWQTGQAEGPQSLQHAGCRRGCASSFPSWRLELSAQAVAFIFMNLTHLCCAGVFSCFL